MEQKYQEFYRGEIYYADVSGMSRCRLATMQPVLVLLTDQGLYDTPTVFAVEASYDVGESSQPTHVALSDIGGLPGNVLFQLETSHPIDKRRLRERAGRLSDRQMGMIDAALRAGFYLGDEDNLPLEVGAP